MIDIRQFVPAMAGKTIASAGIAPDDETGDHQFVLQFTDGSTWVVEAYQRDGDSVEMAAAPLSEA